MVVYFDNDAVVYCVWIEGTTPETNTLCYDLSYSYTLNVEISLPNRNPNRLLNKYYINVIKE